MKLEAQLSELAALGLALEPGVTLEDLLYAMDNGQAAVLFYLDEAAATRINKLSNDALKQAVP